MFLLRCLDDVAYDSGSNGLGRKRSSEFQWTAPTLQEITTKALSLHKNTTVLPNGPLSALRCLLTSLPFLEKVPHAHFVLRCVGL